MAGAGQLEVTSSFSRFIEGGHVADMVSFILQRRLRLWSVNPGDANTSASLTNLISIKTRHTGSIRSILWQPERNLIFTAGADKRVRFTACVPSHCTVIDFSSRVLCRFAQSIPMLIKQWTRGKRMRRSIACTEGKLWSGVHLSHPSHTIPCRDANLVILCLSSNR